MEVDAKYSPQPAGSLSVGAALRRFASGKTSQEHCELCDAELAAQHEHLLDRPHQQLVCACTACSILFGYHAESRYIRVPRQSERLKNFELPETIWNGLGIPIGLAFFVFDSQVGQVRAMYPSPGGPVESSLRLELWNELSNRNPILQRLQPDVEALLVNRIETTREYFRAPIDVCYRLVGLIRLHWRGLSGGPEVGKKIAAFFDELAANTHEKQSRSVPLSR